MEKPIIIKRTFEAAKHPKGSAERDRLNGDPVSSEYMRSYKYLVQYVNRTKSGAVSEIQHHNYQHTRTKAEAEALLLVNHFMPY